MKIAVIGGGIAGLVAAYELVKSGERPVLIEPGQLGGMIRSAPQDGFTCEQGPNVLVERPDITQLLDELKLSSEVRYPSVTPYGQYVWFRNKPVKVPSGLSELITTPLFSCATKLKLPLRLLRSALLKPASDDLSVLRFFAPLLGEDSTKCLLDPVLKGIYGGDVEQLSARSIFPGLWSAAVEGRSMLGYMRSRSKVKKPAIMVIKGGIQRLTDAIATALSGKIELCSERVLKILPASSGGFELRCSAGSSFEVKQCIVTTAGRASASMVQELEPSLAQMLAGMQFAGLTVVHLAVDRREPLLRDAFGVLFPGAMPENLLGVMFNSQIFPHVAPADKHIMTVMLGGAQAGEGSPDEARLREVLPRLLQELLKIGGIQWLGSYTWERAIPQLVVGHHRIVSAINECEGRRPGLVFAGVDRGGVGVSDRIKISREAIIRAQVNAYG